MICFKRNYLEKKYIRKINVVNLKIGVGHKKKGKIKTRINYSFG